MNAVPSTALFVRRFLADYGRNPVNLLFIIVVPVLFVVAAAGSLAETAKLLGGGSAGGSAVQTAAAGWAAGFLSAIAMYFQTSAARGTDRRLVISGLPPARLVTARLLAGLAIAMVASAASLAALAARTGGIADPGRVIAGTLMFAVIYLAVGAAIGALVTSPLNGTLLILFVWMMDVFFGPVFGASNKAGTRALPTHFVSLWMTRQRSGHAGRPGDLGWALVWTLGAAILAFAVVTATSQVARARRRRRAGTPPDQLLAAVRAGLRDWGRNRVLWVLLAAIPAVFIVLATMLAPGSRVRVSMSENGRAVSKVVNLAFGAGLHPAFMAPIAIASLTTLAGMFIILDSRAGDQRLVLAGQRAGPLLAARLTLIALAAATATGFPLAITATVSNIQQWGAYIAASAILALTYALIGVILAPVFGRVAGVFVAFLIPFLDMGIAQDPMLHSVLPAWAHFLPGYGGFRVLTYAILTPTFNQAGPLLIALAWLAGLTIAATVVFRHSMRTARAPSRRGPRTDARAVLASKE